MWNDLFQNIYYNKAINVYKTILTNDHGQIVALCHLASILSHAKEYKRAIKYYKHALSIDENLSFAHFGIGKIYQVNNLIEDFMRGEERISYEKFRMINIF